MCRDVADSHKIRSKVDKSNTLAFTKECTFVCKEKVSHLKFLMCDLIKCNIDRNIE